MEIIPNWHPFFVHFAFALPVSAAGFLLASHILKQRPYAPQLATTGRWTLWVGTVAAAFAAAAGLQAYYSVGHDAAAHAAMTVHLKWALAALVLLAHAAFLGWRDRERPVGARASFGISLAVALSVLGVTGFLGAENVYRHGLGVMRLPAVEGPGHDHSHGEGDEKATAAPVQVEAEHEHEGTAAASHEAAEHSHAAGTLSHTAKEPAAVVDAFFNALKSGDLVKARSLLDPQVRIFESGGAERSVEEYASHHMPADSAFLKSASQEVTTRVADAVGDLAWVASEQRIKGESRGKPIDILSTETMVLHKTADGWRIVHIHWSSQAAKK